MGFRWTFVATGGVEIRDSSCDLGEEMPVKVIYIYIYGSFLKCWYPTTMGFPTKNDHFGVFWGYHHLRKHPYTFGLLGGCIPGLGYVVKITMVLVFIP